jgi:Methylase involved in ubiquinone/menaquinone biosynthesis
MGNKLIYKIEEEKHYDLQYSEAKEYHYPDENEISNNDKVNSASRRYIEKITFDKLTKLGQGEILDYGCAIGERTYKYSSDNWRISGIDISSKSIKVANDLSKNNKLNATYQVMDCENLTFEDNRFDVIYDFGTFSSLDMVKALPELIRVMRPDGYIFSIETLGNNPILKLKRRLNVMFGSRTKWSSEHIMKLKDWNSFKKHFLKFEINYFSLTTIYLSPFLFLIPGNKQYSFISFFEKIDSILLKYRIFQFFAFKSVVVMSQPVMKSKI